MAVKLDTSSWKPQQKRVWNSLPPKVQSEVAEGGPKKALDFVNQQLSRQIDLRGTVGAGKLTGRGDKLRQQGQAEVKGDAGLAQDLKQMLRSAMSPLAAAGPSQAGAGIGGGGDLEAARQAQGLDAYIGMGPNTEGTAIKAKADGSYDVRGLTELDQLDNDPTTMGDTARCSANSSVVGLVMRGKGALSTGVSNTRAEIERRINASDDPAAAREAFGHELATLDSVEESIKHNTLTTNELNSFADVLYQVHDTNKNDNLMTYDDIAKMQESVGLLSPGTVKSTKEAGLEPQDLITDPSGAQVGTARYTYDAAGNEVPDPANTDFNAEVFRESQQNVATEAFDRLDPGAQATVGVFHGTSGTDKPNHIILIGKNDAGEMYCYDPLGDPNYFTGDAAKNHLADHVGLNFGAGSHRNPSNRREGTQYPIEAGLTFMGVRGTNPQ